MSGNITGIGKDGELFVAGAFGWMVAGLGGWVGGVKAAAELAHSKGRGGRLKVAAMEIRETQDHRLKPVRG